MSKDPSKSFLEGLDGHLSKLIKLFRSKRYEDIPEMTSVLENLDKDVSQFILKQSFSPQNDNSVIIYLLTHIINLVIVTSFHKMASE